MFVKEKGAGHLKAELATVPYTPEEGVWIKLQLWSNCPNKTIFVMSALGFVYHLSREKCNIKHDSSKSSIHNYVANCIFICFSFPPSAEVRHTHTHPACFPSLSAFSYVTLLSFHLYPNKTSEPEGFRSQGETFIFVSPENIEGLCISVVQILSYLWS